jgi:hypothetical protein
MMEASLTLAENLLALSIYNYPDRLKVLRAYRRKESTIVTFFAISSGVILTINFNTYGTWDLIDTVIDIENKQ